MIGRTLSHYKILDEISRGGMGIVYKALDLKLNREVALKVLPPELVSDPDRKRRFVQEAQAAAALKHPNIAVVYEIDEVEGVDFIAMELIEGEKLSDLLRRGALSPERAVRLVTEVADGLTKAHSKGIVHRDLKPANIMVTEDGHPKVIDFGLAKLLGPMGPSDSSVETAIREETRSGVVMGTVSYMSPEQALGQPVDARSDLFSLGVMLYEMATGTKPFRGETTAAVFDAILNKAPVAPREIDGDLPPSLEGLTQTLLEKDPKSRFQTAEDLLEALREVYEPSRPGVFHRLRKPQWVIATLLAATVLSILVILTVQRSARIRWAREQAIPEIVRLADDGDTQAAFELARKAEELVPGDPVLTTVWPQISWTTSFETTPPGAEVHLRNYQDREDAWIFLGETPIHGVRLSRETVSVIRIVKNGFIPLEVAARGRQDLQFTLDAEGSIPSGMVSVPGGELSLRIAGLEHIKRVELGDYLIDKYEVTNKQYKKFVDSGGYQTQDFWKVPFEEQDRALPWAEAMERFVDATGRPGPAPWEVGTYPDGRDDLPVRGISWYEAAAFAEFAGKQLPTIFHWNKAAAPGISAFVVPFSNFAGSGPAPVGTHANVTVHGAFDMAGNVREWCWNENSRGERYILGGGFSDHTYMFNDAAGQNQWDRSPINGLRLIKPLDTRTAAAAVQIIEVPNRDFLNETPAADDIFDVYRGMYEYDDAPLNADVETVHETEYWTQERVTLDAAYGDERMTLFLFLPRIDREPFQTILFFPGAGPIHSRSSSELSTRAFDFIIKSGRAVAFPVFKGTFERGSDDDGLDSGFPNETTTYRDFVIQWAKDLGRSIDYIETRADLDTDRLGYYGSSWGGLIANVMLAVEDRFQVAVLLVAGLNLQRTLPEVDQINFVTRVTLPVLMLNGRYDHIFPLETAQIPMFQLLGTPPEHKRHVVADTGHTVPRNQLIHESLDWLDQYLGPVDAFTASQ